MTEKEKRLDHISIVLHRPRISENVGAAARAMLNMGLKHLIVVEADHFDLAKAHKTATHSAAGIVDQACFSGNLKEALAGFGFIACTTARKGKDRGEALLPEMAAEKIIQAAENNRVAILFGPEDRGLTNDETILADLAIRIPTAGFSSLNLSQAVMVTCYELHKAARRQKSPDFMPRLAKRHEMEEMYTQMEDVFTEMGFTYPDNPNFWINRFRTFLSRQALQSKEVVMIRSMLKQIKLKIGG